MIELPSTGCGNHPFFPCMLCSCSLVVCLHFYSDQNHFVVINGFVKTVVFICAHLQAIYIHTNKHIKTINDFSFFSSFHKYIIEH